MRVIVTGAASGIGRATAIRLARDAAGRNAEQAQILMVDIAGEKLEEVVALLRAENARAESIAADLADESAPARVVDAAARAFGGLDGLVSNAGIIQRSSLLDLTVADYERSFAINTAPRGCSQRRRIRCSSLPRAASLPLPPYPPTSPRHRWARTAPARRRSSCWYGKWHWNGVRTGSLQHRIARLDRIPP